MVHCHSCGWSQDDFWNFRWGRYGYWHGWGYNPISVFLSHLTGRNGLWRFRRCHFDSYVAKDYGWKRSDPHNWYLIWWQFKRLVGSFRRQAWWSEKAWIQATKKQGRWPDCPKCGQHALDID